jgi:hypothetical protein
MRLLGVLTSVGLLAGIASAQGTMKLDYGERYDTVLTETDSALVKMTILEFHRKLALAGYASYFWREPAILAQYTDVEADSIRLIGDTARAQVLKEIEGEFRLTQDSLILDRIRLNHIRVLCDTLVEVIARSPLSSGSDEDESPDVIYSLHVDPGLKQWWVGSDCEGGEVFHYKDYLALPDEDAEKLMSGSR